MQTTGYVRSAVTVAAALTAALTTAMPANASAGASSGSASGSSATLAHQRADVIRLVNQDRRRHGCRALSANSQLTRSAQGYANDMARTEHFSHTSADGTTWVKRILRTGYRDPGGENIAMGFSSPASVMRAWINSPEHRRNIRNCEFRRIGVGYSANGGYWVQDFGY
jgi:uncharacterized protein YkwD